MSSLGHFVTSLYRGMWDSRYYVDLYQAPVSQTLLYFLYLYMLVSAATCVHTSNQMGEVDVVGEIKTISSQYPYNLVISYNGTEGSVTANEAPFTFEIHDLTPIKVTIDHRDDARDRHLHPRVIAERVRMAEQREAGDALDTAGPPMHVVVTHKQVAVLLPDGKVDEFGVPLSNQTFVVDQTVVREWTRWIEEHPLAQGDRPRAIVLAIVFVGSLCFNLLTRGALMLVAAVLPYGLSVMLFRGGANNDVNYMDVVLLSMYSHTVCVMLSYMMVSLLSLPSIIIYTGFTLLCIRDIRTTELLDSDADANAADTKEKNE